MKKKDLIKPWDINAEQRHQQLLSGKDISFSKILVPNVLELLRKVSSHKTLRVLDIGCGTGVLAKEIAKNVREVIGIDPSQKSIEIASIYNKEVDNVIFECASIEEFAIKHKSVVEIAIANMTLHSIKDISAALDSIYFCLKPNGVFIFSIPHPCFYLEHKGSFKELDYQYNRPSSYKIAFTISNIQTPLPSPTPFFHRPLQDYFNSVTYAGFIIDKILEPFPTKKIMALYPSKKEWRYPHFLIVRCSKVTNLDI